MTAPMLALSVRQPWAWAIIVLAKDIENRTWWTNVRGRILIHAGKDLRRDNVDAFRDTVEADPALAARLAAAGGLDLDALRGQCGGIVGEVTIAGCVRASPSPWFFGPCGFVLADPKPLPFRPCRGQLGFFAPFSQDAPRKPLTAHPPDLFTS